MPGKRASEDQRKDQIIDAAYHVAINHGLDSVTGRAVAREANLSNGLVYFYFPTKDDLLIGLFSKLSIWVFEQTDDYVPRHGEYSESLFLQSLKSEMEITSEERAKIVLFTEFLFLGYRNPIFFKMLKEAIKEASAYFSDIIKSDSLMITKLKANLNPDSFSSLGLSIIIGSALLTILDEEWVQNNSPIEALRLLFEK